MEINYCLGPNSKPINSLLRKFINLNGAKRFSLWRTNSGVPYTYIHIDVSILSLGQEESGTPRDAAGHHDDFLKNCAKALWKW